MKEEPCSSCSSSTSTPVIKSAKLEPEEDSLYIKCEVKPKYEEIESYCEHTSIPELETTTEPSYEIKPEPYDGYKMESYPDISIVIKEEVVTTDEPIAEVYIEHYTAEDEDDVKSQTYYDKDNTLPGDVDMDEIEMLPSVVLSEPGNSLLSNAAVKTESDVLQPAATKSTPAKKGPRANNRSGIECYYCLEILNNNKAFLHHLSQKHKDKKTCQVCGKDFPAVRVLYEHISKTHNAKNMLCQKCPKSKKRFKSIFELLLHFKLVHEVVHDAPKEKSKVAAVLEYEKMVRFACELCKSNKTMTGFESTSSLNVHYKTRHFLDGVVVSLMKPVDKQVYCCPSCPRIFGFKHGLKRHIEQGIHYDGKKCKFTLADYPGSDYVAHLQELHYRCKVCNDDIVYCARFELNKHIVQKHPFRCKVCDKAHPSMFTLRCHTTRSHKFHCKKKREQFQTEGEFKQHQY